MVDRNGSVWVANLWEHKTRHKGKSRTLYFGPKAQLILRRYIDDPSHNTRLFPIRRDSYGTTVRNACLRAEVPVWTAHWLRYTAASGPRGIRP